MAQRKHKKFKRVDSEEVQGEGSYVVVKSPGFSDMQDLGDMAGVAEDQGAAVRALGPMLARLVIDWNWVDDDGNPLDKPEGELAVIDNLTFQEQLFLVNALDLKGLTDLKN